MQDKSSQQSDNNIFTADKCETTSDHHEHISDEGALVSCDDGVRAFQGFINGLLLSSILWVIITIVFLFFVDTNFFH
jgi:hypothetical protein